MAKTVNLVMLLGHLGSDASCAKVNDATVAEFRLATEYSSRQADGSYKRGVNWHTVKVWNAENIQGYLKKGTKVHVQGSLRERSWEKDGDTRYATEVVASARGVTLLGSPRPAQDSAGRVSPAPDPDDDGPGF